jgi:hypothetical protein
VDHLISLDRRRTTMLEAIDLDQPDLDTKLPTRGSPRLDRSTRVVQFADDARELAAPYESTVPDTCGSGSNPAGAQPLPPDLLPIVTRSEAR